MSEEEQAVSVVAQGPCMPKMNCSLAALTERSSCSRVSFEIPMRHCCNCWVSNSLLAVP